MSTPIFITGTGTDVGKTIVSVVLVNALNANYWKPVQAGTENTDRDFVQQYSSCEVQFFDEAYKLAMPASPHIAAKKEGINIDLNKIAESYKSITVSAAKYLIIEGAGGIFVPLNDNEFVIDLIKKLNAKVVLVSRNYLGSINHSLLTAEVCRVNNIDVLGWIFSDEYMHYENQISQWTNYPVIGKIPQLEKITKQTLYDQSLLIKDKLLELLKQ